MSKVFKKGGKDLSINLLRKKTNNKLLMVKSVTRKKGESSKRKIIGILYTNSKEIPDRVEPIMAREWVPKEIIILKKLINSSDKNIDEFIHVLFNTYNSTFI